MTTPSARKLIREWLARPSDTMSANGLITGRNTRAETIFGWCREAALGRNMEDLLAPERLGYSVTTRTDPVEALSEFRHHPGEFHLVITDLTMPHMTGTDLARQISQHSPNTPVLLTTGSSGTWTLEKVRALGIHDLMEKPASAVDLAITVHRLLTRAAEEPKRVEESDPATVPPS